MKCGESEVTYFTYKKGVNSPSKNIVCLYIDWIILNAFPLFSQIIILKPVLIGHCSKSSLHFYCSYKKKISAENIFIKSKLVLEGNKMSLWCQRIL